MSDLGAQQTSNANYLSVATEWIQLRLQRAVPNTTVAEDEIASAEAKMLALEALDPLPSLVELSSILVLTRFEQNLLLLCAAVELDTKISHLCAQVQGKGMQYPTFGLAFALFDRPMWQAILPERPLRYWELIKVHQSGTMPLMASPLKVDERIVSYLKGLNYLDHRWNWRLVPLSLPTLEKYPSHQLAPSQQQQVATISHRLAALAGWHALPIIQLLGCDRTSKKQIAQSVAAQHQLPLYQLRADRLPTEASELESLIRLWQREVKLLPLALYLDGQAIASNSSAQTATMLQSFLESAQGLFFLDVPEQSLPLDQPSLSFEVAKPTSEEQWQAWKQIFGRDKTGAAAQFASQFNLNLADIGQISAMVQAEMETETSANGQSPAKQAARTKATIQTKATVLTDRLWDACLQQTRPRLETLAQRLETKATWDDLVLPETQTHLLRQIAAQVRHRNIVYDEWGFRRRMNRGLGVNALFAGESGTGKTMAAEVIANELRLNLYRIDLSAVVSKYIGETEKNLRRLFDAAEDGGAILFFDEADALFGKRSEVKDSHDRYANIEINYLLQRIEAYKGLAILATNLRGSMDNAFLRRLRFIIDFPFPSVELRQQMWQKVFPPQMPLGVLDSGHLARLNLTGGSIHAAAINAAFLAAHEKTQVGMSHVLAAARDEFRKLNRPVYEADFHWNGKA